MRDFVAAVIASGATEALPIFERIEVELARRAAVEATLERARAIAAAAVAGQKQLRTPAAA